MNKNIIIGTAGHIDHGKTTLIGALTGADTDRLKEEKKRGISIDLGFANFQINEKKNVGIIDVPGHEKFLKNMLAGVCGMDLVLLVVSAEEGVMPQTREHLDILHLIGLTKGIVVITKADKVEEEFLDMVREDIQNEVQGTFLQEADILAVDSISKRGMKELVNKIDQLTEEFSEKNTQVSPRLFVDRAFSIKGFGTVVTGTLIEGKLRLDDEIYIYPERIPTRVRGIQVHSSSSSEASAGQRVALNLSNISLVQVKRGDILSASSNLPVSMMIDAKITVLDSAVKDLEHWDRVRVYHGAREIIGRVVPLEEMRIPRGSSGFVQIRLEEELSAKETDHIILRLYSPMQTIGGGVIVDANPLKHNVNTKGLIENLKIREEGNVTEKIEHLVAKSGLLVSKGELCESSGIHEHILEENIQSLVQENKIIAINQLFIHMDNLIRIFEKMDQYLSDYHRRYPYRKGMNKEELRGKISKEIKPKEFDVLLQKYERERACEIIENILRKKGFVIRYEGKALQIKNELEKHFKGNQTPMPMDKLVSSDSLKSEILSSLIGNSLVLIGEDTVYDIAVIEELKKKVQDFIAENGKISIQDFKEMTGLSRKYMIAIFEYFDREKITKREGDYRVCGSNSAGY